MPYVYDPSKRRICNYDATWNAFNFGGVDHVDPSGLQMNLKPVRSGSVGDVDLGDRIVGLVGSIIVAAEEIDTTMFQTLCPWWTTGSIGMLPATWHQDLYQYAQKLTLHPNDQGAATDQDLNLLKTVPVLKHAKRDGVADDVFEIEFKVYPDRSQLTTSGSLLLAYGYIGVAP